MKRFMLTVKLAGIAIVTGLLLGDPGNREAASAAEGKDFDVLARGPIHEGFAQPSELDAKPALIVGKEPPPPVEEVPPELKPEGKNVQWIAGYWAWDDEMKDFVWVSGFWRDVPPGRVWVPGYWTRLADGWTRVIGYWADKGQGEQQYFPKPPPTLEAGPSTPVPGADYSWIPGIWVYQGRYLWRPGYWLQCRRGWAWTPARYCWTPSGYLYVRGYWDYPLDGRGVLFAPARFHRPVWTVANWAWRPSYVVSRPYLFNSLFVRPGAGFYFGDYYAARYAGQFTPWIDYRLGKPAVVDPLYGYHRWAVGDPNWERNLAGVYAARRTEPGPMPRTLAEQMALKADGNRSPLMSLAAMGAARLENTGVKLQPLTEPQLKDARAAAQQVQGVGQQRQKIETQMANEKGMPRPNDAPRTAKLDIPRLTAAAIQAAQGIERRLMNPPPGPAPGKGPEMGPAPRPLVDKVRTLIPPEIKSAIEGARGPQNVLPDLPSPRPVPSNTKPSEGRP